MTKDYAAWGKEVRAARRKLAERAERARQKLKERAEKARK